MKRIISLILISFFVISCVDNKSTVKKENDIIIDNVVLSQSIYSPIEFFVTYTLQNNSTDTMDLLKPREEFVAMLGDTTEKFGPVIFYNPNKKIQQDGVIITAISMGDSMPSGAAKSELEYKRDFLHNNSKLNSVYRTNKIAIRIPPGNSITLRQVFIIDHSDMKELKKDINHEYRIGFSMQYLKFHDKKVHASFISTSSYRFEWRELEN